MLKSVFLHANEDQKIGQSQILMKLGPQMSEIRVKNWKGEKSYVGRPL